MVVANKDSVVNIVDRVLAHLSSFNTSTKTDYSMVQAPSGGSCDQ